MRVLLFSDEARDDFVTIAEYTQLQWGAPQRRRYLDKIYDKAEALLQTPLAGILRSEIEKNIRSIPVAEHVIYYTVSKKYLHVIRILHQSQDVNRHIT